MTIQSPAILQPSHDADLSGIALCLSGGGLRATLFHLGLIKTLRQARLDGKMALASVREIYAVSGGSILAGHFLANYARYIDEDPDVFAEVEKELLTFANRDLRNRILRRWPFRIFGENPRGRLLQAEYHRFLNKKTIGQSYAESEGLPTFHFLATSFTNGALCSFSRTVFEQVDRNAGNSTISTAADGLPLAFAVAASSAFPPMFPPMCLTPKALGTDGSPPFNTPIALSDGGVFDNFGIDKFFLAQRKGVRPGLLIVSNAGGSFATDPTQNYEGMMARNIRASDILMRRVGDTTLEVGERAVGKGLVVVRIGKTVQDPSIAETTQLRFRMVRTDLDRFNNSIAGLISDHGERVAREALTNHRLTDEAPATFHLQPPIVKLGEQSAVPAERNKTLDQQLSSASRRSWYNLFLDLRDPAYIILWWTIGLLLFAGLLYLVYSGVVYTKALEKAKQATAEAKRATAEVINANDEIKAENTRNLTKLEKIRRAAFDKDMTAIQTELAIAIESNKNFSKSGADADGSDATAITPERVRQIIDTEAIPILPSVNYPQKVYIQFAGDLKREQIAALNQMLKQAGWAAQGASGERTSKAAGKAEVRYAGDNAAVAQALADALNHSGLPIRKVSPSFNKTIGDNLEVWISN